MKLPRNLYLVFLIIEFTASYSQSNLFLKSINGTSNFNIFVGMLGLQPQGLDTLSANSFVLGGHYGRFSNSSNDTLVNDAYLIKNEISGVTKWFKKYHVNGRYFHNTSVTVLKNKNILAFGTAFSLSEQQTRNGTILKTDSNGFVKNLKLFPQQTMEAALVMKNGDVAVLSCDSNRFIKLFVMDTSGSIKWCKKYFTSGQNAYRGLRLIEGKNGAILILGYSQLNAKGFLILSDSAGNKIQDITYNSWYSYFLGATNYFDEGYYVVGALTTTSPTLLHSTIFKFDNYLNLKTYNSFCYNNSNALFSDIIASEKNSFLILSRCDGYGGRRVGITFIDTNIVVKRGFLFTRDTLILDSDKLYLRRNGTILFTFFSGTKHFFGITDTISNGFCGFKDISSTNTTSSLSLSYNTFTAINSSIIYSTIPVYTYLPTDAVVEYTCSSGPFAPLDTAITPPIPVTNVGIRAVAPNGDFIIYPNPASELLTIEARKRETGAFAPGTKINLYNAFGECVFSLKTIDGKRTINLNTSQIPSGIYLLGIKNPEEEEANFRKILIVH